MNQKFETKRQIIESQSPIFLVDYYNNNKIYELTEKITIKDFIVLFIKQLNFKYDSYATNTLKRKRVQCYAGANRSAGDIYRICKYYFSDEKFTLFDIMNILYSLVQENKIRTFRCTTIYKRVFVPSSFNSNLEIKDEFGLCFNEWKK